MKFYYTEVNGTATGRRIMRAQFARTEKPADLETVAVKVNGTDKTVKLPKNWKPIFNRLGGTEEMVKDCKTEEEVIEFLQTLPEHAKIG